MDTNKNQPDLEARFKKWKATFSHTSLTHGDIEELSLHMKDSYDELLTIGLNENEAWLVASHRIGEPAIIKEEFKKVNHDFTVDRNWMMLLWGAVSVLILQAIFIILPLLFTNSIIDFFKQSNNNIFLVKEYYSIAVILIVLFILLIIRNGKLVHKLTNSLVKYASLYAIIGVIAGLWAAFCSYMLFANYSDYATDTVGYKNDIRNGLSFLMFGFYFPLMAITGFSTMKYFSREMVSFKAFNKNINWKHAIILGVLAQAPVQFGNAFPGDSNLKAGLIITVSILLFMVIGCMVSYSKKPVFNLVCAQVVPMSMWIISTTSENENVKVMFFVFYFVKILSLAGGYFWSRQKQKEQQKQMQTTLLIT